VKTRYNIVENEAQSPILAREVPEGSSFRYGLDVYTRVVTESTDRTAFSFLAFHHNARKTIQFRTDYPVIPVDVTVSYAPAKEAP
jgi:hypothetical protein